MIWPVSSYQPGGNHESTLLRALLGAIFSTALCAGTLVNNSDGLPQATGVADGYAL